MYSAKILSIPAALFFNFLMAAQILSTLILSNSTSLVCPIPGNDEICKRSMQFIATTLVSSNTLVQSIANYCVMFGRYSSFIGTNALLCCNRYNWSLSELISNLEHIKYFSFKCWHFNGLSDIQNSTAGSLFDFIAIRDRQLCLPPLFFSSQQLGEITDYLCTSLLYALFWVLCNFCHVCLHITCVGFMYLKYE